MIGMFQILSSGVLDALLTISFPQIASGESSPVPLLARSIEVHSRSGPILFPASIILRLCITNKIRAIWQNLDIEKRTNTIAGTITYRNMPPSRNATLDDIIDVGVNDAFQGIKVRDAMSTTEGPFCYIYV